MPTVQKVGGSHDDENNTVYLFRLQNSLGLIQELLIELCSSNGKSFGIRTVARLPKSHPNTCHTVTTMATLRLKTLYVI